MRLSTLLFVLGLLLWATTLRKWSEIWGGLNRTLGEIHQDFKAGRQRTTLYGRIVSLVVLALFIASVYLSITGR